MLWDIFVKLFVDWMIIMTLVAMVITMLGMIFYRDKKCGCRIQKLC